MRQAQSICFKIQCDQYLQTAAKDATGERAAGLQALASTLTGQGITVSNIVNYMSLIEQRSIQVGHLSWSVDGPAVSGWGCSSAADSAWSFPLSQTRTWLAGVRG